MAVLPVRVDVAQVAIRLDNLVMYSGGILIRNRGANAVFIGDSAVTAATGYQLDAGEALPVDVTTQLDGLYAIAVTGTNTCHVLQVGA